MGREDSAEAFRDLVRDLVEPIVTRAGFEWNDSGFGAHEDEITILYEADPADFWKRFPGFAPSDPEESGNPCIDLWLRLRLGEARVEANVEGPDLEDWLRSTGHHGVADKLSLAGADLGGAVAGLAEGLDLMLRSSSSRDQISVHQTRSDGATLRLAAPYRRGRAMGEARSAPGEPSAGNPRRVLTVPNLLSALRILLIPGFVALLVREDTRYVGFLVLAAVVSTDWVDGYIARRTGQVTELGKVLDPLADRLAMAAALITFVAIDALPLWAALLILVRDGLVLLAALALVVIRAPRIDVRRIGKIATFTLMWGFPLIAWGNLGLVLDDTIRILGWTWFAVGTVEYYAATLAYVADVRAALARR